MSDKLGIPKGFWNLKDEDKDLTMFTITNLTLTKEQERNMVYMAIKLKRKVVTELLTTYLPTILLLLITFTTIFFDKDLFGDVIAVNLTIMLVMTTIFTSKIEELPPTSDMKMIDIWLICCLVIPFLEVILRTTIECLNCGCDICEGKDANVEGDEKKRRQKNVVHVSVGNGAKVAPEQVTISGLMPGPNMCNNWNMLFPGPGQRKLRISGGQGQGKEPGGLKAKMLKRDLEAFLHSYR